MVDEETRRTFLRESATTGAIIAPPLRKYLKTQQQTIRIESDGGGVAVYEFAVSGSVRQEDSDDEVTGNRAYGHLGPDRGTDTFTYTGEITGLELAGPATLTVNGNVVDPRNFPPLPDSVTSQNIPQGNHRLRIESNGGGVAAYEFTVNGSVSQVDDDDQISGSHVYGHVGPDRGTDTFTYSGSITQFVLTGPATLFIDGQEVTPQTNPSDSSGNDTSADPLEGYRQAVEGMNSLAENPGEPNDGEWVTQFQTRTEQVQNNLNQLVEQDYRFSVDVGEELTIQIEEPGQAPGLEVGRTPVLTLTFGVAAIKATAMLKASAYLSAAAGGAWVVGTTQTVNFQSASQAISTLYSSPWTYMLVQLNHQQMMAQGLRCLVANQAASQVAENADTSQLESWAEEILEQTGTCPGGFNEFHNLAQDIFQVIEDNTDEGGAEESIEFLDCTTVRITGNYQEAMVYWTYYAPNGIQNQDSVGPIAGSKTVTTTDLKIPGEPFVAAKTVIDAVELHENSEADMANPDVRKENPQAEQCQQQAQSQG